MIQKLEYRQFEDHNGNTYGGIEKIVDKLNEMIDCLNQLIALHKIDYEEDKI